MSVVFSQYNSMLQESVSSGVITGQYVYFTLPWWSRSDIRSIRVWNTSNINISSGYNIYLLSNGAHYRYSPTENDHFRAMALGVAAKSDQLYTGIANFAPPVFMETEYNENYTYVMVDLGASKTNITVLLDVVGQKTLGVKTENMVKTPWYSAKDYRIIIGKAQSGAGGTGGTIYDVTQPLSNRGGENASQASFSDGNDYIYVGSSEKLSHWDFGLTQPSTINTTLTAEYWNGTTWSSSNVSLVDNTSTGNSDTMKFSGLVELKGTWQNSWIPTILEGTSPRPLDPLTTLHNSINAGTMRMALTPLNPPRYWVRFKVGSTVGSTILVNHILPVKEWY
mgnify:CR=1 FL=1